MIRRFALEIPSHLVWDCGLSMENMSALEFTQVAILSGISCATPVPATGVGKLVLLQCFQIK